MRSVRLTLLMFFFINTDSLGQLNESDTVQFQIRIGVSGFRQTGNVDLGIIRSKLDFVARLSNVLTFKTQNNTLYQEFNGFKADNDINSRNFLYYQSQNKIYPFAILYVQQNFRRRVDSRIFSGLGLTWQIIQKKYHIVKLSASSVYEETKFSINTFNEPYYAGKNSINLWRPTTYINGEHKFEEGKITFHYTAYWQVGLDQVSNQRFQYEIGFNCHLFKALSLTVQYLYVKEEIVASLVSQDDRLFSIGFDLQIKK